MLNTWKHSYKHVQEGAGCCGPARHVRLSALTDVIDLPVAMFMSPADENLLHFATVIARTGISGNLEHSEKKTTGQRKMNKTLRLHKQSRMATKKEKEARV